MWHWIQNGLSKKRQQFFFDILIFVTSVHFLCILCACIYQSKRGIEQISLIAPDIRGSTLVFVPLHKKIEQPKTKASANSVQKPHHMMNYDEFLDRQKKAESAKKSGVSKTGIAKPSHEKKAAPKKPEQKKSPVVKSAEKKAAMQKSVSKKTGSTVQELSKKVVDSKKPEAKKVEPKKSSAATSMKTESIKSKKTEAFSEKQAAPVQKNQECIVEKQVEKVVEQKVEEIPAKIIPEQNIAEQKAFEPNISEQIIAEKKAEEVVHENIQEEQNLSAKGQQDYVLPLLDMNDVTFVGVQDLEHLQIQQLVAGQLAKHWKRPVGMANKICVIRIELHANGTIINAIVEKSSGVPMYDMAAKSAALKTVYPQEIWNKKLVIQF